MKKVQEEYGMLDQEKIEDLLVLASTEVKNYFGYKNVNKSLMELEYDPENNINPRLTPLVYRSFSIRISVIDIEKEGALTYEYLIWRMTDAQKKVFGIPLDKEVLKED